VTNFIKNKDKLIDLILQVTGIDIRLNKNSNNFFTKEFERIKAHFLSDYETYWDHLLYFHYFISQFEKIKKVKPKDFSEYLKKLSKDDINLRGEKFEILTYARLIDHNIAFSKPKLNPDFEINLNDDTIFIECGTRQTDKDGYYVESLIDSILKKEARGKKQNYSNLNTALHIEMTKTFSNSLNKDNSLTNDILIEILNEIITRVSFGAVVFITTFYSKENGIVYGNPLVKYNSNVNKELIELHETIFNLKAITATAVFKPFM
jgi:hypothetical protein